MKPWAYIALGIVATFVGLVVMAATTLSRLDNPSATPLWAYLGALVVFLGIGTTLIGVIGEGVRIGNRASQAEVQAYQDVS